MHITNSKVGVCHSHTFIKERVSGWREKVGRKIKENPPHHILRLLYTVVPQYANCLSVGAIDGMGPLEEKAAL